MDPKDWLINHSKVWRLLSAPSESTQQSPSPATAVQKSGNKCSSGQLVGVGGPSGSDSRSFYSEVHICDSSGHGRPMMAATTSHDAQLLKQDHSQRSFMLVMDTDIYLRHLDGVEQLLNNAFRQDIKPTLIVPYIIFHELDNLKGKRTSRAQRPIRFLNDLLIRRDRIMSIPFSELGNTSTDRGDIFIDCCKLIQRDKGKDNDVLLISNDDSLRIKAEKNSIQSFNFKDVEDLAKLTVVLS